VLLRFVMGLELEGCYVDDPAAIAYAYLSSTNRFW
jgi:hypothetical protein